MELRLLRYFLAVAEERHFGRAAARLHMSQPPLSRAVQQLERELGVGLLTRSPAGVELTAAGGTLLAEARALLEQVERAREKVVAAGALTIGTLVDSAGELGRLAETFRQRHPGVAIRFREADFADPACGLRGGLVDVAITRGPFDSTGLRVRTLRAERVGVLLRADDPLAGRGSLSRAELAERTWFRLPESADPVWREYWSGPDPAAGPVVRTVSECVQAVLWNGSVGLAPLGHALPEGLALVPLRDQPPSPLVVAWDAGRVDPLVRSFVAIAAAAFAGE